MKSILYSSLLVWLVYIEIGFSQPTFNATDSSLDDNQIAGDERSNVENENARLNTMYPETRDIAESRQSNYIPRKDLPSEWGTRDIFSRRRDRSRQRHGMSPRSFSKGRRFGYFGRYPSRFSGYAPYAGYERDQYESYPQRFEELPMYSQQPFAPIFPNYQQTDFSPQSRSPYSRTQSYLQPQIPVAPPQSYYRNQYDMQLQQPQQFATTPPYFGGQRVNAQPQSAPPSYYTNRPGLQWENEESPVGSEFQRPSSLGQFRTPLQSADQRVGAGPQQMTANPTLPENRYQPTGLKPSRAGSFDQFRASPQPVGRPNGARSRTVAAPTVQGNSEQPIESEIQRSSGFTRPQADQRDETTQKGDRYQPARSEFPRTGESLDHFGNSTQAVAQRDGTRSPRENDDQRIESERQLAGSNDQLKTSTQPSVDQRDGPESSVGAASTPQENGGQLDVQRPLSGLMSFFRSPSATTAESNNSRSIVDSALQQTREQPAVAQIAPQAVAAA